MLLSRWYLYFFFPHSRCLHVHVIVKCGFCDSRNSRELFLMNFILKQRIYWELKNLFINFSKLALICISYHCGAWYAFHTFAKLEWHRTVLSKQQKWSDVDGFMTLKEGYLWYYGPSCYGNRVVHSFLQWYETHTSVNFEKSKTPIFSKR